ncbi:MAG TPA: DUF4234 domain-containing protein [Actinomycetota bacterium]|nr:DUF4234 domain-containing protein [Actinomycetota bacterium]
MADEIQVGRGSVKRRDPWGTFLLGIVTLKIYHFVWYYMINREIRDHSGDEIPVDPVVSVLAITLGIGVVVPALVSLYRTADRIRRVQKKVGAAKTISPILALLLGAISFFNLLNWYMPYVQSHINSAWDVEFARAGR